MSDLDFFSDEGPEEWKYGGEFADFAGQHAPQMDPLELLGFVQRDAHRELSPCPSCGKRPRLRADTTYQDGSLVTRAAIGCWGTECENRVATIPTDLLRQSLKKSYDVVFSLVCVYWAGVKSRRE